MTQPIGTTGDSAPRTLLDVLSAITTVSLVAAAVPEDASIRTQYEVVDIGGGVVGGSIVRDAFGFLLTQVRMCRLIRRRDEGTVLFFGTTSYALPIVWSRLIGRTVVVEPRGDVPLRLRVRWEQRVPAVLARSLAGCLAALERVGYRSAHAIVTYTPAMATELGLDRYDHKLHTAGARYVDTDQFAVRRPLEERDPVVGYIGRFEEGKGVRALARAVPRLPEDVTVRFVGDGPLSEWLETELADEIAAGRVELTGWIEHSEVPEQLNDLRLLVLPSESEGLPTIILEALACGTPVYATPVSGVPDVVCEGETGFLMADIDADTIATGIRGIVRDAPLTEISDNGRALVEAEYSYDAAVERYRRIMSAIGDVPGDDHTAG